jgi:hypothetical protein
MQMLLHFSPAHHLHDKYRTLSLHVAYEVLHLLVQDGMWCIPDLHFDMRIPAGEKQEEWLQIVCISR